MKDIDFPDNYVVLDIETTGLSPRFHEIIELSALKIRNNEVVEEFSELVKPEGRVNYFITNLTGITNDMLKNSKKIHEVLPQFLNFISTDIVIGHNVNFDVGFIQNACEKHLNKSFINDSIDTMKLSKKHCALASNKLQSVAEHYNIDMTGHHRALNDCKITLKVYLKIKEQFAIPIEQKQLNL